MKKRTVLFTFAALLTFFLCPVSYAEFKLATVDIGRVLNECKEAVGKRKELEQKSLEMRKKFEERSKKLKETEDKLKAGAVAQDSKEAEKFKSDAREFSRQLKDADDDLRGEFLKISKAIGDKALKIVGDYAKTNDIDLVLDKGGKNRGPVLYGNQGFDITDAIIQRMDK